jgi:hypothetical protein
MDEQNVAGLNTVIKSLQVPSSFSRYDNITEGDVIARLGQWKNEAHKFLGELRDIAHRNDLTSREQAQIISTAAPFNGSGPWVSPASLDISRGEYRVRLVFIISLTFCWLDIFQLFCQPEIPPLVLRDHIKPLFQVNPHPSLNISTGRKLARPAGGHTVAQDYYEGQTWKEHPGADRSVLWCLRNIRVRQ